jgi:hypothetical protein
MSMLGFSPFLKRNEDFHLETDRHKKIDNRLTTKRMYIIIKWIILFSVFISFQIKLSVSFDKWRRS